MTMVKKLFISMAITFAVMIGEVVGGILSNSLALLSDAGHMLTDAFALGISLLALMIMRRPPDRRATYGYHRIGILAALINGVGLIVIAFFIFFEAYKRLYAPPEIDTAIMMAAAFAGLAGNVAIVFILGHRHDDLNVKSAWYHVLGDTISSAGVIAAALIIRFTGWQVVDPAVSCMVGLIIIAGGIRVSKEALRIFLELSPLKFDLEEISRMISLVPGVVGIHDVHIWSIGHEVPAFSAHIQVRDQVMERVDAIRQGIEQELAGKGIRHSVLQMECAACEADGLYCRPCPSTEEEENHH